VVERYFLALTATACTARDRSGAKHDSADCVPSMLDATDMFSSYGDVNCGISEAPLERWRSRRSPTEISVIETCFRGTMEQVGYPREQVSPPLLELARTWASVPVAVARAGLANRKRLAEPTSTFSSACGSRSVVAVSRPYST
jgi:hypothetical protein